jgi:C1A family cysteine protease
MAERQRFMSSPINLKQLRADLEEAGRPWEMDETTSMAQMTEDQRESRLGFTPPPDEPSLAEAVQRDAEKPATMAARIRAATTPAAPSGFDHRNVGGQNYTTPVKDQGGCGSCVAFGTVAVMETTYRRQNNDPALAVDLSEAHLFYCHGADAGRNCSNGWWPDQALDKARDIGVTTEAIYPYTGNQQSCQVGSGWQNSAAKVSGRTKLDSPAKMKDWLATRGSITGCFIVYQDFYSYRSGVYRHISGESVGGHCVEIVGYSDPQGCWICKNSWGPNWGEGGFFRIAYGECQIETWSGPFGANDVSMRAWENNVRINGLWSNEAERNAWVHVVGSGWRKVAADSAPTQTAMLMELMTAKAGNRPVNLLGDPQGIREVYVL